MQGSTMIEIFRTDLQETYKTGVLSMLRNAFPHFSFNVDLDDCDRILRIKGDNICAEKIVELLTANDFFCERLA
jgi:hypothetical protein